jgi:hypothetical protein
MPEPKGTLANIEFQCRFGFDIRFQATRGTTEANVKSTTLVWEFSNLPHLAMRGNHHGESIMIDLRLA